MVCASRYGFAAWDEAGTLLLIGECRKADVIAHFTRRDEAEIVINPDDVEIIEPITINRDEAEAVPAGTEANGA